ncbi:MAG: PQQ-binding-like beta-propeller repeat protein [Pirellulaceae bacterium]
MNVISRQCLLLAVLIAGPCGSLLAEENWPMWRGPRGDGTSLQQKIPTAWSGTENIAWKVAIPGQGHASPIVWQDRVFLVTCLEDGQRLLLCLDRNDGTELWRKTVFTAELENHHQLNSRASSTPATDGELVYVSFLEPDGTKKLFKDERYITPGRMVVAAYDLEGNLHWKVRPGEFASIHGYCSPPVIWEDRLLVNGDHDGDSYLLALDKETGETIWKTQRENKTRSYSTPIIREIDGRTQMILSGNMCVASYDPADGSRHWIVDGPTEQFVASVVYNGELIFMTCGFPDKLMQAIRPDGKGNVTDTHVVWESRESASYVPSPVAVGDYFLLVADNGIASQYKASTGKRIWRERLGGGHSASLITAGGLVYFTSDTGTTTVVRPGEKFDLVAKNELGERVSASPAVSQGQLFLRGFEHLYCIGEKE